MALKVGPINYKSNFRFERGHNLLITKGKNKMNNNEKIINNLTEILGKVYEIFCTKEYAIALKALNDNQQLFYSQYVEGAKNEIISAYENLKGIIYLSLNEVDNAKICFESALNLNPESSQACSGLGEVFYLKGEDKNAKIMYEWGVKHNPQNLFAKSGLSKVNLALGLLPDDNSLMQNDEDKVKVVLEKILDSVRELYELQHYEEAFEALSKTEENFLTFNKIYKGKELLASYYRLKSDVVLKL